jgi:hypothetical protein
MYMPPGDFYGNLRIRLNDVAVANRAGGVW